MLRRPATVQIPLPSTPGDVRNSVHPFVGKGPLGDLYEAGVISVNHGVLRVLCDDPVEFKVGALSERGEIQVRLETASGPVIYRRQSPVAKDEPYAHGHPIEVFNAPELAYFEVESHSRLATLSPGESVVLIVEEDLTPAQTMTAKRE